LGSVYSLWRFPFAAPLANNFYLLIIHLLTLPHPAFNS
jgi:hypothetical protein